MPQPDELTPKELVFIDEYLKDLNATQAYIKAGYSAKTATVCGPRLLAKARVQKVIQEKMNQRAEAAGISQEWVIGRLIETVNRCMQSEPVLSITGEPTGLWKFDAKSSNKALELIGKHLGMFADKVKKDINLNVNNDHEWDVETVKRVASELSKSLSDTGS